MCRRGAARASTHWSRCAMSDGGMLAGAARDVSGPALAYLFN
jgi:hypothetical protein